MKTALALAAAMTLAVPAAQAAVKIYTGTLSGAAEVPSNASPGSGWARVTLDDVANTMRVQASFAGLSSPNTAAHIHCCALPGNNASFATTAPTFAGFPTGATSGAFDSLLDMSLASSYRAGFITANGGTPLSAFAALEAGLDAGMAYFNIHTQSIPGGELRGNLAPVPEPSTYALMALGLAAVGAAARRRRT